MQKPIFQFIALFVLLLLSNLFVPVIFSQTNTPQYAIVSAAVGLGASNITCVISSSDIPFNGSITVSGIVTPPHTGAEVILNYTKPNGSNLTRTTTMNQLGSYNDTYNPGILGNWKVQASWMGDEQYAGNVSSTNYFTVGKTLIICSAQSAIFLGDTLIVRGSLSPSIGGAEIKLVYNLSSINFNLTRTVTTLANGSFTDAFIPSAEGIGSIIASWSGDVEHMSSQNSVSFAVNPTSQTSLLSAAPITLYWHRDPWYCSDGDTTSQRLDTIAPTSNQSATVSFYSGGYYWIGHGHWIFKGIHTGQLSEDSLIVPGLWNLSIWAAARTPDQHFEAALYYWNQNHEATAISSWTATEYFNSTSPRQFIFSFNISAIVIPKGSCLGFVITDCRVSNVDWYFDSTLNPSQLTVPPIREVVNYTLNVMSTTGGSMNLGAGNHTYLGGTEVTVNTIPQTGFTFDHWEIDGVNNGSLNPYKVTMYADHTIKAVFKQITYTLSISSVSGGITNPILGTYTLNSGTSQSVLATANTGYAFDHWMLDGVNIGSSNPYTVTMNANHTLQAVFKQITYTLTISAATGGTTNPASGTNPLTSGTSQSVLATANTGYIFDHWIIDGANAGTVNPINVTMNSNHVLQATFSVSTISLSIVAGTGGTANPSGIQILNINQSYQFFASPNSGYGFDHWELNGQDKGSINPLTLNVAAGMLGQTLTALFIVLVSPTPTVTPSASPTPTPTLHSIGTTNPTPTATIPEFPSMAVMSALAIGLLVSTVLVKRKIAKK